MSVIKLNHRAKLESCIFGKNTKVGSKADVVRCITQAGYEIGAGGEYLSLICIQSLSSCADTVKGEKLDVSDWTTALDESDNEDDESEDEEEDSDE